MMMEWILIMYDEDEDEDEGVNWDWIWAGMVCRSLLLSMILAMWGSFTHQARGVIASL